MWEIRESKFKILVSSIPLRFLQRNKNYVFSLSDQWNSDFENFFIVQLVPLELTVQDVTVYSECWLDCGGKCHCYLYVGLQVEETNSTRQVLVSTRRHQHVAGWWWWLLSERTEQVSLSVKLHISISYFGPSDILPAFTKRLIFSHSPISLSGPGPPNCRAFTITLGRNSLEEWSARHRDLYLTTHSTNKRHISASPAGFEPAISESERPQTHALDRAATRIGNADAFW